MPADDAVRWRELATARLAAGRLIDALNAAQIALRTAPREPAGFVLLGEIALAMDERAAAVDALEAAYALAPRDPATARLLATAHLRHRNPARALEFARHAAALEPESADAAALAGAALFELERIDDARNAFALALARDPHHPHAMNGVGAIAEYLGDDQTALARFEAAVAAHPDFAEARTNRALVLIRLGRLAEGYADYHAMMRTPSRARSYPYARAGKALWRGEPLAGRRLLVAQEQGFGDMVQMLRYVPQLPRVDGPVAFELKSPLAALVRRSFPQLTVVEDAGTIADLSSFDLHVPAMQLPAVFRSELATIPAAVPYLVPDAAAVERVRAALQADPRPTVGVAWRGNPSHRGDRDRSTRLADWAPLARLTGIRFISLQYAASAAELALAPFALEAPPEPVADFDGTAALIAAVDAVVSVDTVVAHLAGALARPALLALPTRSDYRWMRERADTPWYPTVRLVRQAAPGLWTPVFSAIASNLERLHDPRGAGLLR